MPRQVSVTFWRQQDLFNKRILLLQYGTQFRGQNSHFLGPLLIIIRLISRSTLTCMWGPNPNFQNRLFQMSTVIQLVLRPFPWDSCTISTNNKEAHYCTLLATEEGILLRNRHDVNIESHSLWAKGVLGTWLFMFSMLHWAKFENYLCSPRNLPRTANMSIPRNPIKNNVMLPEVEMLCFTRESK